MAKKGASFMYKNKKITADEAIELLKNKRELDMKSKKENGKTLIRITEEPITRN